MHLFAASLSEYQRLPTKEVNVGGLLIGNYHPIRLQTMTTTDTMNTQATVEETIRCVDAGAELVRITAPSKKEAENLLHIKQELHKRGYNVPLVADIHFTPNAAEIAARIVEKVRINPGNYVDKKKFEKIIYSDADYLDELERIRKRFIPLIQICKQYGTAMRIGTNHGSLSDRIMSRYGDTPMGMVESAMEFLRIARNENYHNIVLSMKASNPIVMVEAYRLLAQTMQEEFNEIYPLHLGVTEAGDGEDGRIKSAVGMGTLLEDGIGDTIRVSLTEASELEIPVCENLVKRYKDACNPVNVDHYAVKEVLDPLPTLTVKNIGGKNVPVVITDLSKADTITKSDLNAVGYTYLQEQDKWRIADLAADYIFVGTHHVPFPLPGTLKLITHFNDWQQYENGKAYPIFEHHDFPNTPFRHPILNFVRVDCSLENAITIIQELSKDKTVVLALYSTSINAMQTMRSIFWQMQSLQSDTPAILLINSNWENADEHLIHYATEAGGIFISGFGNGICLGLSDEAHTNFSKHLSGANALVGRNYNQAKSVEAFLNNTSFGILQATRKRITKTEYISCPSCGRTLFDLQETTEMIRKRTNHLKGVKIAIMGCIVNGPGEMADADFGYVGSGVGKITLYKGKEVVKRNIDSNVAVEELIQLLKDNDVWIEP